MSKNNNRDDFSPNTIRCAGERVGLRCSICGCLTKAASEDDDKKVINIGVASHISAAAPGGPRYNPNLTSIERKDISNCIWLCQTHAKLIDVDTKRYTSEYLIDIKRKAEETVRNALIDGKGSLKTIENSGFDINTTKEILLETIRNGDFVKLKSLLNSLEKSTKSKAMQDLFDYVTIVYSFYCDRENLIQKIKMYVENSSASYIDNLMELFIVHMNKEYLQCTITVCKNTNLLNLANLVLNDAVNTIFIHQSNSDNTQEKVKEGSILHKLATNYATENKIYEFSNPDGTECPFYVGDFYFQQKVGVHLLGKKVFNLYLVKEQKLADYSEYNQFNNSLSKIKCIVPELQLWFWKNLLSVAEILSDREIFNLVLLECNERLRNENPIKRTIFFHQIDVDVNNVSFDELRKFCGANNDYSLLHCYFNTLLNTNPKLTETLINDHRYLLKKESLFLEDYIQLKKKKGDTSFSAVEFLLKYASAYEHDIGYNILLAFYSSKKKKNREAYKTSLNWLKKNVIDVTTIPSAVFHMYLYVLRKNKDFKTLLDIADIVMPINLKMTIAKMLCESKEYKNEVIVLLEKIKQEYGAVKYINQLLFECYYHKGDVDSAKKSLMAEIDIDATKECVASLLSLRLETKEIVQDKYFEIAKELVDSKIYYLIGITYLESKDNEKAYQYLLKSLLLDDKDLSCLNAIMSLGLKENEVAPNRVCAGATVVLKSENKKIVLSIHDEKIIDGFLPNRFMGNLHYSEDDSAIGDMLYRSVGEKIMFRNSQYEIVSIDLTSSIICRNVMQTLVSSNRAIAFSGKSADDVRRQLVDVLKKQNEHINFTIKFYNEHNGLVPLTLLADSLGRKILEAYAYLLFESPNRLLNYYNREEINLGSTYVLSMESIYLLALLEISEETISRTNCIITLTTKRTMLSEINTFIESSQDSSSVGQIYLRNDNLYRIESSENDKYDRLRFWNKVKRIVNTIPCCDEQYFYDYDNQGWSEFFAKSKLQLDADIIGCLKHNSEFILVSDNIFTSQIAIMHNLPVVNMNLFLMTLGLNVGEHLQCIQKLAQFNFANYFPAYVYRDIKRKILLEKDSVKRNEYINNLCDFLAGSFLSNDNEKWKYNNRIVESLVTNCKINIGNADSLDRLVIRAISYNYSKEHPDEFMKIVEKIFSSYLGKHNDEIDTTVDESSEDDN